MIKLDHDRLRELFTENVDFGQVRLGYKIRLVKVRGSS